VLVLPFVVVVVVVTKARRVKRVCLELTNFLSVVEELTEYGLSWWLNIFNFGEAGKKGYSSHATILVCGQLWIDEASVKGFLLCVCCAS
jgi:hypothetical protein